MPIHLSNHPSVQTKVSQLRASQSPNTVSKLTGEIAALLATEAAGLVFKASPQESSTAQSATGAEYNPTVASPSDYVLIPVLRSGLAMVNSFASMLPSGECPVHHLGLYREKSTLSPVEYYNKLPVVEQGVSVAFVVDPVIATGGTADAVVQTLNEWGAKKVVFVCILASKLGIERVSKAFPECEFVVGAVDDQLSENGYIIPGIGDIGDRLYTTM